MSDSDAFPMIAAAPGNVSRIRSYLRTTPGRLEAALALIILMSLLFGLCAYFLYADLRDTFQTVGRDTAPSILAAERMKATLADANANAINSFLVSDEKSEEQFWSEYHREMNQVHDDLLTAAQNITYGNEERIPILTIMTKLAEYERLVAEARARSENDFMTSLDAANRLMREIILPAGTELDRVNFAHLTEIYKAHRNAVMAKSVPTMICGLLLIAILAATQIYLVRKMRRLINPGLVLATLSALLFFTYAAATLSSAEAMLFRAKQDAFDSVHALWQARAVAYDANADESLFLLDHGQDSRQARRTADFRQKTSLLAEGDPEYCLNSARNGSSFKGFLGDEITNVTFAGEREAAMNMIEKWISYIRLDDRIRELEASGRYEEAVRLNIGTQQGQSNWAFDQFDKALGETLDINKKAFDDQIAQAFGVLGRFPSYLVLAVIVIMLAAVGGLKPRIREYGF